MNNQLSLFPDNKIESLIIIGNGFDLAHSIESSYWDFKNWLEKNNNQSLINLMDTFFSNEIDLWSSIEEALGKYNEKDIFEYCRPDEEFDYEHSLSSSARIEDAPDTIFEPLLDDFKKAFCEWVKAIDINDIDPVYSLSTDCRYLTFNYTDTLEKLYHIPQNKIAHIHGSRLINEEFVVGHNKYRDLESIEHENLLIFEEEAQKKIVTWMNEFKKDYNENIKKHESFFNSLVDVKQIITYGHSMNEIDWPYFKKIIDIVGPNIPWRVKCYSETDLNNMNKFTQHFNLCKVTKI